MKRQTAAVALLLTGITLLSLGVTALTMEPPAPREDSLTVTAAFFPLYTAALQVVGDTEGVTVRCLTEPSAGCMHDYQLSPDEMAVLTASDLLILNGLGAESFLDAALASLPDLVTIDTSVGIQPLLLCEDTHHDHEHDHDHGLVNEHIWTSPARYAQQVTTLRDELCRLDPDRAAVYTRNAEAYLAQIDEIGRRWAALTAAVDGAVLFHDSVAYAAEALGVPVLATLPVGEDHGVSAGELTAAAETVRGKRVLLLFDRQYPVNDLSLPTYAGTALSVVLETAAGKREGVDPADAWLVAMEANVNALKEALMP